MEEWSPNVANLIHDASKWFEVLLPDGSFVAVSPRNRDQEYCVKLDLADFGTLLQRMAALRPTYRTAWSDLHVATATPLKTLKIPRPF